MNQPHSSEWRPEWESADRRLRVESTVRHHAGRTFRLHRVRQGPAIGAGAVAVTLRVADTLEVLLVHQDRPIPGVTLWELPRGMADDTDEDLVATARRELLEETGISAGTGRLLGPIHPDSGLLSASVGVVLFVVDQGLPVQERDGEVDDVRWFPVDSLGELIVSGDLRDGVSLAAMAVARASGAIDSASVRGLR